MNLQLVSPYKKCPYGCPFCVAATDRDYPWKDNLYETDKKRYFDNLEKAICDNDIETAVITGDTEPTLFKTWIDDCVRYIAENHFCTDIEIQTKNYSYVPSDIRQWNDPWEDCQAIDAVAYSCSTEEEVCKAIKATKNLDADIMGRVTMLLNAQLPYEKVLRFSSQLERVSYIQTTVKILQLSVNNVTDIDNYIYENIEVLTGEEIKSLGYYATRVDLNCMDAENRYIIFRIDGKVYKDWVQLPNERED